MWIRRWTLTLFDSVAWCWTRQNSLIHQELSRRHARNLLREVSRVMQWIITSLLSKSTSDLYSLSIRCKKCCVGCQSTINWLYVDRDQLLQILGILQLLIVELAASLVLLHDVVIRTWKHLRVLIPWWSVSSNLTMGRGHLLLVGCHRTSYAGASDDCSVSTTISTVSCCHHYVFLFVCDLIFNLIFQINLNLIWNKIICWMDGSYHFWQNKYQN